MASCTTAFNGSGGVCFRVALSLAPDAFPVLALAVVGQACRCRRLAALVSRLGPQKSRNIRERACGRVAPDIVG